MTYASANNKSKFQTEEEQPEIAEGIVELDETVANDATLNFNLTKTDA